MSKIRIASYNIHGGRGQGGLSNLSAIRKFFDEWNVDIAVIQEMETRPSWNGALSDIDILAGEERKHHHFSACIQEEEGWFGNLILSRFPILQKWSHNLETSHRLQPRMAADALIETPISKIRIIGTHLSLSMRERTQESINLMRLIAAVDAREKAPLFLMGDINEWRGNVRLIKFLDSQLHHVAAQKTFPSFFPLFRLDRVWHDAPSLRVEANVIKNKKTKVLSDHLPLLVDISRI